MPCCKPPVRRPKRLPRSRATTSAPIWSVTIRMGSSLPYIDRIKAGHIVPGAPWTIIQETGTSTVIDGNWGFGYVVTDRAMRYTIDKAENQMVAAATVYRQSHIGRLASYPLMAAREGMIAMITADSGRSVKAVAPFGGAKARLGTNPICFAVP